MSKYQPLRITAYPRVGIQSDAYFPLDGILLYYAMRQRYGAQDVTLPGQVRKPKNSNVNIPLKKLEHKGEWFWAISFAQWGPCSDGRSFWTKRFDRKHEDLINFQGKRGRVIVEQSRYKSYHMPVFYRHALYVRWYAIGDMDAIRRLLCEATHIGKKTAQGCGRINRWEVEPWPHDWTIFDDTGRLMRAIPDPGGILYGFRPPYWLRENQAPCRLPDAP